MGGERVKILIRLWHREGDHRLRQRSGAEEFKKRTLVWCSGRRRTWRPLVRSSAFDKILSCDDPVTLERWFRSKVPAMYRKRPMSIRLRS